MRKAWALVGSMVLVLGLSGATATLWPSRTDAVENASNIAIAELAVSPDAAVAEAAREELRRRGRPGHEALMRVHRGAVRALREAGPESLEVDRPADARLRRAIDHVSGQRDGHASGLYWHTDLEQAKQEAASRGVPILSLQLLGRLDEELSCANSRYFRVILYSDPAVAARMNGQYVLHWSSERPVPRVTIDMGDGREHTTTLTGNSVHYVLDPAGRPVDAIVGLYSPAGFLAALSDAERAHAGCAASDETSRPACLARHHAAAGRALRARWADLRRREAGLPDYDRALASLPDALSSARSSARPSARPSASDAMVLTLGKSSVETILLDAAQPPRPGARRGASADLDPAPEEPDWLRVAMRREHRASLAASTAALLRLKSGDVDVDATASWLADTAAADGERNELLFRRRVHEWFASGRVDVRTRTALNAALYRELLWTPADDPWLGLQRAEVYDAVERGRGP